MCFSASFGNIIKQMATARNFLSPCQGLTEQGNMGFTWQYLVCLLGFFPTEFKLRNFLDIGGMFKRENSQSLMHHSRIFTNTTQLLVLLNVTYTVSVLKLCINGFQFTAMFVLLLQTFCHCFICNRFSCSTSICFMLC